MSDQYKPVVIGGQVYNTDPEVKAQTSVPSGASFAEAEAIRKSLEPKVYTEVVLPFHQQKFDSAALDEKAAKIKAESIRQHEAEAARRKERWGL